jgi:hypothetical protein
MVMKIMVMKIMVMKIMVTVKSHSKENSRGQLCPPTGIEPGVVADHNPGRLGLKENMGEYIF